MNKITFLPGKAWLSIPKFESHLYAELDLLKDSSFDCPHDSTRIYNDIKKELKKKDFGQSLRWKSLLLQNFLV